MQDFHFTAKSLSKASPSLFLACATGQHIKTGIISVRKQDGDQLDYYKVIMSDVLISSYSVASGGPATTADVNADTPMDQFSINFQKIEFEYRPQLTDGTLGTPVKAGYDLKTGKKV